MKRLALLFSCSAALVCATDLTNVHTVYLLKMGRGMDQFLASRLTEDHIFQVVTDPKQADAVFTDQIGEGFEAKLEDLFPSPDAAKLAPPPKEDKEGETNPFLGDTVNKLSNPASASSFGRARGTVFLVDAKSRRVIWSVFEPAKSGSPRDLDRTASDIVNRLKHQLKDKERR
jgi:hypothetical protein